MSDEHTKAADEKIEQRQICPEHRGLFRDAFVLGCEWVEAHAARRIGELQTKCEERARLLDRTDEDLSLARTKLGNVRREWKLDQDYTTRLQNALRRLMLRHNFLLGLLGGELVLYDTSLVPWRRKEIRESSPVAAAFDDIAKVLDMTLNPEGAMQPLQTQCSECGLVSACDEDGCCLSCGEDLFADEDGKPRDTAAGRLMAAAQERSRLAPGAMVRIPDTGQILCTECGQSFEVRAGARIECPHCSGNVEEDGA